MECSALGSRRSLRKSGVLTCSIHARQVEGCNRHEHSSEQRKTEDRAQARTRSQVEVQPVTIHLWVNNQTFKNVSVDGLLENANLVSEHRLSP